MAAKRPYARLNVQYLREQYFRMVLSRFDIALAQTTVVPFRLIER